MPDSSEYPFNKFISNHIQLGGIETSVLDNGPGKGARIAWINTGTGLRYKVVIDRTMDIADAFYNQHSLTWISHSGITFPNSSGNTGTEWLRTFGGGLLTTCGLSHVGGPESDQKEERGLHGRISNLSSELVSIFQPDIGTGELEMSITGVTRETTVFGPTLELRRTISSVLGQPAIKIRDQIKNCGNEAVPHMLLYHCNFGWPLADEGTDILWEGDWESRGTRLDNKIFRKGNDFKKCLPPQVDHNGSGEACVFVDTTVDASGNCFSGLHNHKLNLAFLIRFKKEQLPCLTNWQHFGNREYVTALEPGTNFPIGQKEAREQGKLIHIEPGECRYYELEMEIMDNDKIIRDFVSRIK